jgi:hypothetical protein
MNPNLRDLARETKNPEVWPDIELELRVPELMTIDEDGNYVPLKNVLSKALIPDFIRRYKTTDDLIEDLRRSYESKP